MVISKRIQVAAWGPHAVIPGLLLLALLVALTVYWALLGSTHERMRENVRADVQQSAGHTAHAMALQFNAVVRTLDYFSQQLAWVWLQGDASSFHDSANVATRTLPEGALAQVAVADAAGRVRYSSLSGLPSAPHAQPSIVSIADREHFLVHQQASQSFLFISEPIKGRISQKWTIQFSRGLWQNGRLEAVVVLAVSADYLAAALKAIFPDQRDAASLLNDKGQYLARSYYLRDVLGRHLPADRPFINRSDIVKGAYEAVGAADGINRFYNWQRVEGYPLIVLVGLDADKTMAVTNAAIASSQRQSALGSALLFLAGLTVAVLSMQRSKRSAQLQRFAEALKTSEAQLRITLDAVRDGLWTYDHVGGWAQWDERIRKMLGYDDYTLISVETARRLIHPSDMNRVRDEAAPLLDPGRDQMMNIEFRLQRGDGRWLWVLARGRVIEWTPQGQPLRSVGTLTDISQRVADALLRDALLDRSAAAILLVDQAREIIDGNARFLSIFLHPGQSLRDFDMQAIHVDHAHAETWAGLHLSVRSAGSMRIEFPFKDAAGGVRWFEVHGVLQDPEEPQSNIIWTWIDVTSRREAHAALAVETLRLNTLLECFPGGVLIEDAQDTVIFVNTAWPRLLGLDIQPDALCGIHDDQLRQRLGDDVADWLRSRRTGQSNELRKSHEVMTRVGLHLEVEHIAIRQNEAYLGSVWLLRDITERKQHELELSQLASTDTLTGLPNRRSFMERLLKLHKEAHESGAAAGVIMMLDIDHFKRVNDTYGHASGDIVLKDVAQAIRNALRSKDVPGRLGGEEFAVLLPNTGNTMGLAIAERIRKSIEDSCTTTDGQTIKVTISIGLSTVRPDYLPDALLQQADEALYKAKSSGRNRVCEWQETLVSTN